MNVKIDYLSEAFPHTVTNGTATLDTNMGSILWAALTVGRPNLIQVRAHGASSLYESLFRLAVIRMTLERGKNNRLQRTKAFEALDPTEKGMMTYFMGMTMCKLFAHDLLDTPWLLHLDVYNKMHGAHWVGHSRPDLFGDDAKGRWHGFECKGRSVSPTKDVKAQAKAQAQKLLTVGGAQCDLHIGTIAYFTPAGRLRFFWRDPSPDPEDRIDLPEPGDEWRYHYLPAISLAETSLRSDFGAELELADVTVEIHPEMRNLLAEARWQEARSAARKLGEEFSKNGFMRDGLKVIAGDSWAKPFDQMDRRLDRGREEA
jgi:hypothetical protein